MIRTISVLAASLLFTGCASIMNETTHPLKVEAKTSDGQAVTGAECRISNDYGSNTVKTGDTAQVRRSNKDMDITCKTANQPDANGRLISRANAGLAGNIIFGGGIGALIDHSKGTAYTYPTWIQLIFGKTLVFDRRAEKEGQPVVGADSEATTAAAQEAAK